ncbi:hypothetical protein D3C81_2121720 [compost metagenome]
MRDRRTGQLATRSDVIDVDDLAYVIVLKHYLFGRNERLLATHIKGVKTGTEVTVGCLVTKA